MDTDVARTIAKLQYTAVRLPFTLLDEGVVARYWDRDAAIRVGFERWLGSLDLLAGRLLADDEISRRGRALMRLTRDPAQADPAADAPVQPAPPRQVPPELPASDQAPEGLPAADVPAALPAGDQTPEARAEASSRAVLQALAEQVDGDRFGVLDRLASQLPGNLQTALRAGHAAGQAVQLDEFYQRVGELAGVPPVEAEDHARAVVATLAEQVTGAPLEEFFARLPQDYRSLLPEKPQPDEAGDFLRRVQRLGELGSRAQAETATRLTLSALGDRISGGQAAYLAATLPDELRSCLEQTPGPAQAFGIEEFLRRIADPQQTDLQSARQQAKAVLRAVREYAPGQEISDTVAQLPPDLVPLLS